MKPPRVSVVCIFLDEEEFIREAVESVLAQTFQDFELLLVDDGSSDGSTAIARAYAAGDPARIRYFEHPGHANRGMAETRNLGLAQSRGEYFAMMDADDRWHPEKLAEQVAVLDAHPDVGMVCGGYVDWRSWAGGRDDWRLGGHVADRPSFAPETTLQVYPLGWASSAKDPMIRRSVAMEVGGYEPSFPNLFEDQAFFAKVYLATGVIAKERIWVDYRRHPQSWTIRTSYPEYLRVERAFFDWLEDYVAVREVAGKQDILAAIGRARSGTESLTEVKVKRRLVQAGLFIERLVGREDRYRRHALNA